MIEEKIDTGDKPSPQQDLMIARTERR